MKVKLENPEIDIVIYHEKDRNNPADEDYETRFWTKDGKYYITYYINCCVLDQETRYVSEKRFYKELKYFKGKEEK